MINTLRPRQNGRHFPDNILKCIFLNENIWISITISLKFVSEVQIINIPALVQIMAWHQPGHKPLFEPIMLNTLRPGKMAASLADDIFKYISLNENFRI